MTPAQIAAWQADRFARLRPKPTPYDDELPVDLLADPAATRRAIARAEARAAAGE